MRVVEGATDATDGGDLVADLRAAGEAHGATVQAFDARYVVDRAHLETALERADRAFERGENVARDRAVEVLLYAAGRRQIDQAMGMGIPDGGGPVVAVVAGGDEAAAATAVAERLDDGPGLAATDPERVRAFFEVGDAELAATGAGLSALVRERVALLDVEK